MQYKNFDVQITCNKHDFEIRMISDAIYESTFHYEMLGITERATPKLFKKFLNKDNHKFQMDDFFDKETNCLQITLKIVYDRIVIKEIWLNLPCVPKPDPLEQLMRENVLLSERVEVLEHMLDTILLVI